MYAFLEEVVQELEQSLLEVNTFVLVDGTLTMQMLCAKCWGTQGPIARLEGIMAHLAIGMAGIMIAGKLNKFSRNLQSNYITLITTSP